MAPPRREHEVARLARAWQRRVAWIGTTMFSSPPLWAHSAAMSLELATDQHEHGTERHDFCRLAAEQQARESPSPMRSHYNEITGIRFRRLNDRLCRKVDDV